MLKFCGGQARLSLFEKIFRFGCAPLGCRGRLPAMVVLSRQLKTLPPIPRPGSCQALSLARDLHHKINPTCWTDLPNITKWLAGKRTHDLDRPGPRLSLRQNACFSPAMEPFGLIVTGRSASEPRAAYCTNFV